MGSTWERPSWPVLAIGLLALGAVGFLLLRPGGDQPAPDRPTSPLSAALDRTLETGGGYTAVAHFVPVTVSPFSQRYQGVTPSGTTGDDLTDQRAVLNNLDALTDIRTVGEETIDGVATTHYSAAVDLDLRDEYVAARLAELGGELPDPSTNEARAPLIDVWIDGDGLIRRFYVSEAYKTGLASASTTIDFYDFNKP